LKESQTNIVSANAHKGISGDENKKKFIPETLLYQVKLGTSDGRATKKTEVRSLTKGFPSRDPHRLFQAIPLLIPFH
jgi:hypothetical protein